jgi:ribonuclease BN (tRNA processing enzyme)
MTSFLIDGQVAIDAGAITRTLTIEEQRNIRHVVLSHSHIDHTGSVPILIDNVFGCNDAPLTIYSTKRVLLGVKRHLFNNDTWPDFTVIPNTAFPAVKFVEVEAETTFVIPDLPGGDLEITAIPVNHIVPTVGFLLRQGSSSVLFTSDTGPTDRIWEVVNQTEDLAACITECSFPNHLREIADVSLHLCPETLAAELEKITRQVPVYLYHLKPAYLDQLRQELAATSFNSPVEELEQDRTYHF